MAIEDGTTDWLSKIVGGNLLPNKPLQLTGGLRLRAARAIIGSARS